MELFGNVVIAIIVVLLAGVLLWLFWDKIKVGLKMLPKMLKMLLISVLGVVIAAFAALWLYVNFIDYRIGAEKVIRYHWYGWVDETDARKFKEFTSFLSNSDTSDAEAANKMIKVGLKAGLAREFAEGEIVYITDKRLPMLGAGFVKVRPRGEIREYWIGVFWVTSKKK